MGAAFLLILMQGALSACALTSAHVVELPGNTIRLGDVVAPACLQDGALQGDTVLAALPRGQRHIRLSHRALINLARRRVPDLPVKTAAPASLIVFATRPSSHPTGQCFVASRPIGAGEIIDADLLHASRCNTAAFSTPVVYERETRVVRARERIDQGAYLGPLIVPAHRYPDAGDALVLVSTLGATRVERPVVAAQAAPYGNALFVQDADGRVFRTRLVRASAEKAP